MFKTVLTLALLLVVKVLASPLHTTPAFQVKHEILQESPCAVQGGMCRLEADCLSSQIVRLAELCPLQTHSGAVCCYYLCPLYEDYSSTRCTRTYNITYIV